MYCRNCGNKIDDKAAICVHCGVKTDEGNNFCKNCGAPTVPYGEFCTNCGISLKSAQKSAKSSLVAGLLGVLIGGLGVHSFYLGNIGKGILQIVVTILTCGLGSLWGFIEGIMILVGKIHTDADGNELKKDF